MYYSILFICNEKDFFVIFPYVKSMVLLSESQSVCLCLQSLDVYFILEWYLFLKMCFKMCLFSTYFASSLYLVLLQIVYFVWNIWMSCYIGETPDKLPVSFIKTSPDDLCR